MPSSPGDRVSVGAAQLQSGLVPVDARVLLAHVLGVDRAWLIAHARDPLPREAADAFFELARRRRDGEPVAYLVGSREFHGLRLSVTPAVLIPRPETETLVEAALARLPERAPARVLDLGTGSGAIALALASVRPRVDVLATDASLAALDVARANAQRLALANVRFLRSDWYAALGGEPPFELIASNPPYISANDPHLAEGDLRHEPRSALSPGIDGLAALRTIVDGARSRLRAHGHLVVEHGYDQSEAVLALMERAGFVALAALRDLAGVPRVAAGRLA